MKVNPKLIENRIYYILYAYWYNLFYIFIFIIFSRKFLICYYNNSMQVLMMILLPCDYVVY